MNKTFIRNSTVATAAALLIAAAFTMSGPSSAKAQDSGRGVTGSTSGGSGSGVDAYAALPDSLTLSGVIRDFKERSAPGGHPDFEKDPSRGFGHYVFMVQDDLDSDGKPVFAGTGQKVTSQSTDAQGRNIPPKRAHLDARDGDRPGRTEDAAGGACTDAARFSQWYRDVNGVNLSMPMPIVLKRNTGTNVYTFNDRTDSTFRNMGGFFPINGQLFGNSGGSTPNQNFHFTYELDTTFVYKRNAGQVFTFTGDDDVWVFIDGKCVIDIGGVHSAVSQTIDLDRCSWLEDGQRYSLKFFFAERHRTQSNFRIDTTLTLQNADLPTTSALFD